MKQVKAEGPIPGQVYTGMVNKSEFTPCFQSFKVVWGKLLKLSIPPFPDF